MRATIISSCAVSPAISMEQFIPEHFFLYLVKGTMVAYDGNKEYQIKAGDCGIARRNHLAKYNKQTDDGKFEKIIVFFEQEFLKKFSEGYKMPLEKTIISDGIMPVNKNVLIENFIASLPAYINRHGAIEQDFIDIKRTELLMIILKQQPELANVLFDFGIPEKIDLEAFMNKNYKFNVNLQRFAYLTGRSLTTFKKDFEKIFNDTPSHWLVQKRLEEAHFLIEKKGRRASDIYVELGFEDLSHFSFAFKKKFGVTPTGLTDRQKKPAS
ncbi:AraC family transcriptional regulator [Chitinophaga sp. S165]|uniref:helix-turn-helix domain-containing protein n=1 Tax=Chitinophaga sp. S165 TaxID=2135462 RepID=UPI000D70DF43|nr:AraC family transcriptional regulator [Chitinophaga sp. S165]PWV51538.1 AraC-like DNA-binding protein [Chitinophaga sp. S165]